MRKATILAAATLFAASTALAFGPHDNNCKECHSLHKAKGKAIIGVEPNKKEKNPSTGGSSDDDISLCLGCHNDAEGIMPIMLSTTHPVGMKPGKVKVPGDMLRTNGALGCTSCHDPHPSNPNYKYLRSGSGSGAITKGGDLGKFCAICHAEKVDMGKASGSAAAPAAAPVKK